MRLLYVVQRYGDDVVGGSERACRDFAEHLARRGHEVEVLTSCARDYLTWADHYAPGSEQLHGVTVHRLPVRRPRDPSFAALHDWVVDHRDPVPLAVQRRWTTAQGPDLAGQRRWLLDNRRRFDAALFMTYLYATTTRGLPTLAGELPTVLQPTAHDEPPLHSRLMDSVFRQPDALAYFTPEERDLVSDRFGIDAPGRVVGLGIDLDPGDAEAFRRRPEVGDRPYLLYAGRVDPMKGFFELLAYHREARRRGDDTLLVVMGDPVAGIPDSEGVLFVGFLDEADKRDALAGATAVVVPSYLESFSIVLCEAWAQRRPALVQAASPVLQGQVRRAAGGFAYRDFAEFDVARSLLRDPALAARLGANGRRYVEDHYAWPTVLDALEHTIDDATAAFARRRRPRARAHPEHDRR